MALETRLELPSGGWVEMRDANFLRTRDRDQMIRRIQAPENEGLSEIDKGLRSIQILAGIMITAWSLPYEPEASDDGAVRAWTLPKNDPTIMEELFAADGAVIDEKLTEARKVLLPSKASPDQHADKESPSSPESA